MKKYDIASHNQMLHQASLDDENNRVNTTAQYYRDNFEEGDEELSEEDYWDGDDSVLM